MHNHFAQAEGVANLDQVPEAGALVSIGFAKPEGGTGGYARYVAIAPADWPHGVSVTEAPGAPLPKQPTRSLRDEAGVMRPTPATEARGRGARDGYSAGAARRRRASSSGFPPAPRRTATWPSGRPGVRPAAAAGAASG